MMRVDFIEVYQLLGENCFFFPVGIRSGGCVERAGRQAAHHPAAIDRRHDPNAHAPYFDNLDCHV